MSRKTQLILLIRKRLVIPAVGFLLFTMVVSVTIFIFAMRSGVPKFSLPALSEILPSNVHALKQIYQLENGIGIINVTYSPDGRYLAVARQDKILHVWSTQDYHLIYTFNIDTTCVNCVAFSPDGRYIASVRESHPEDLIVWDTETGKSPWESLNTDAHQDESISSLVFSPDGAYLVEAFGNRIAVWAVEANDFVLIREIEGFSSTVDCLAFSPDGKRFLTVAGGQPAQVWEVDTGNWLMTLDDNHKKSSKQYVTKAIFAPDGTWIVTADNEGVIRFWDSQSGLLVNTLEGDPTSIRSLAFNPNGQILASGGSNNRVLIWDVATKKTLLVITGDEGLIPLTFSPDNKIFVSTDRNDKIRLWGVVK